MIPASSRYSRNVVTPVSDNGTTRLTIMPRTSSSRTVTVTDYAWRAGDRVDTIAARTFGDETLWWVLADANPQILDWTGIPAGTVVRIPSGN